MSDPFVVALIALGISVIASAVRMIDWFIHSDPKAVARMARWAVVAIAVLSVPLLFVLLFKEQWTAAVALAAGMILVAAVLGGRMLRWMQVRPLVADRSAPVGANSGDGFDEGSAKDIELVRRSAAVLEAYLHRTSAPARGNGTGLPAIGRRTNGGETAKGNGHTVSPGSETMSEQEALAVLGLEPGATEREISEAHHRIAQAIHPDGGGSHYLAIKVDQARASLLRIAGDSSRLVAAKASRKRKPSRRRPHQRPPA
jgi:hypothetical protein